MSSTPMKKSFWLAGDPCCLTCSYGPCEPSGTAGPRPWVGISRSAIGADIASSYITHALWGVISNGEWSGKMAFCTLRHALSTLH
jgi:hypothetical protein